MARSRIAERGLLPYVILSQTVPLIALAPLVVSWGGKLKIGGFEWQKWMSAAVISAFLAFFPVAVGGLRGLKSASKESLELMSSYAANGRQTLFKLRFPRQCRTWCRRSSWLRPPQWSERSWPRFPPA